MVRSSFSMSISVAPLSFSSSSRMARRSVPLRFRGAETRHPYCACLPASVAAGRGLAVGGGCGGAKQIIPNHGQGCPWLAGAARGTGTRQARGWPAGPPRTRAQPRAPVAPMCARDARVFTPTDQPRKNGHLTLGAPSGRLAPRKSPLPASNSGPTPRRAESDFLSDHSRKTKGPVTHADRFIQSLSSSTISV